MNANITLVARIVCNDGGKLDGSINGAFAALCKHIDHQVAVEISM